MLHPKRRESRKKNKKTQSRKKNKKTQSRKKNKKTQSRKKNKKTQSRTKTLIGQVGGKPYNLDRLLIHVPRNKIESFNTIKSTFEQQFPYKPSVILESLQSFKIDKFSILDLINYLKVDNKNIVLSTSEETFEYLVFYVKDNNLKYFSFSTHEFLDYINSNINPLYAMTEYFGRRLENHIFVLGNAPEEVINYQ